MFSNLLRKDWDERLEDDKLILERILILVRNVLQVPTNVRAEQRADGERQNPESKTRKFSSNKWCNPIWCLLLERHWSLFAPFLKNGDRLKFYSYFPTMLRICGYGSDFSHRVQIRIRLSHQIDANLRPPVYIRLLTLMRILIGVPN